MVRQNVFFAALSLLNVFATKAKLVLCYGDQVPSSIFLWVVLLSLLLGGSFWGGCFVRPLNGQEADAHVKQCVGRNIEHLRYFRAGAHRPQRLLAARDRKRRPSKTRGRHFWLSVGTRGEERAKEFEVFYRPTNKISLATTNRHAIPKGKLKQAGQHVHLEWKLEPTEVSYVCIPTAIRRR